MTRDLCCTHCRGPLALCTDRTCWHHIEAEQRENRDDRSLRLYKDPTSRKALNRVERAEKARAR